MFSSKRGRIRLFTFVTAALLALGLFSYVSYSHLLVYRRQTGYDARRAFAQSADAIESMSRALEKSLYATDGGMCGKICAEICSEARSAETALAALPFSTETHEQIKSFVGLTGDYAYTLCSEAAGQGFTPEQREAMAALSETASSLAETLREMKRGLSSGELRMDSREKELANVGLEQLRRLSESMDEAEAGFAAPAPLRYDGLYSAKDETYNEPESREAALAVAAEFFAVPGEELSQVAAYADESCYSFSCGTRTVCVNADGLLRLTDARLVDEPTMSAAYGRQLAEEWLSAQGYEGLSLVQSEEAGPLLRLSYAPTAEELVALDRALHLTVALDDGSLYALDLTGFSPAEDSSDWPIGPEEAQLALPESLSVGSVRRVTLKSPGGLSLACYEFLCHDTSGKAVTVYVNAETGKQQEIVL